MLSLAMTTGDQPQATIVGVGVVQCGQARDRIVRVKFAIGIVLVPSECLGVSTHLEGELASGRLNIRPNDLRGDINDRTGEIVLPNERRAVMDVGQECVLQPTAVWVIISLFGAPSLHALFAQFLQALLSQRLAIQQVAVFCIRLQFLSGQVSVSKPLGQRSAVISVRAIH